MQRAQDRVKLLTLAAKAAWSAINSLALEEATSDVTMTPTVPLADGSTRGPEASTRPAVSMNPRWNMREHQRPRLQQRCCCNARGPAGPGDWPLTCSGSHSTLRCSPCMRVQGARDSAAHGCAAQHGSKPAWHAHQETS